MGGSEAIFVLTEGAPLSPTPRVATIQNGENAPLRQAPREARPRRAPAAPPCPRALEPPWIPEYTQFQTSNWCKERHRAGKGEGMGGGARERQGGGEGRWTTRGWRPGGKGSLPRRRRQRARRECAIIKYLGQTKKPRVEGGAQGTERELRGLARRISLKNFFIPIKSKALIIGIGKRLKCSLNLLVFLNSGFFRGAFIYLWYLRSKSYLLDVLSTSAAEYDEQRGIPSMLLRMA